MIITSETIINNLRDSRQKLIINSEIIIEELSDDFKSRPHLTSAEYNHNTTVLIWQRKCDHNVDRNREFRVYNLFPGWFYDIEVEQLQRVLDSAIEIFDYIPEYQSNTQISKH